MPDDLQNMSPLEEWNAGQYHQFMRPTCSATLYPNRPALLRTALAVLGELRHHENNPSGPCLAARVAFDQPVPRHCLLVIWRDQRMMEYFDPDATPPPPIVAVDGGTGGGVGDGTGGGTGGGTGHATGPLLDPTHAFETCLRKIAAFWGYTFHGSDEIFGTVRTYHIGPEQAIYDRIFPPPQRAAAVFVRTLVVERLTGAYGRQKLPGPLQQHVTSCTEQGHGADNLFWCLYALQQADADGTCLRTWVRGRDWYEGAVDYVTIGARVTKHLIGALDAVAGACRRARFDRRLELGILT
jgi:hypothetical protein